MNATYSITAVLDRDGCAVCNVYRHAHSDMGRRITRVRAYTIKGAVREAVRNVRLARKCGGLR